jgi:hypothetical protein
MTSESSRMTTSGIKRTMAGLVLIACAILGSMVPSALGADKEDPAFAKWWQKFQLAVTRRDIRAIDKGVEFPMDWQVSPEVRAVRSESDFAANFLLFFTPDVIKNIATGKPEKQANGNYVVPWKSNGKDYLLNIRSYNGTYAMESLMEGRP